MTPYWCIDACVATTCCFVQDNKNGKLSTYYILRVFMIIGLICDLHVYNWAYGLHHVLPITISLGLLAWLLLLLFKIISVIKLYLILPLIGQFCCEIV